MLEMIFVDIDACPVIKQVESVAKWHGVPVTNGFDWGDVRDKDFFPQEKRLYGR